MRQSIIFAAAVGLCGLSLQAQTRVDLRSQSKTVDFQSAQFTKPLKTGSALPATCTVGEMFFLATAVAGLNVYGCPAVNTWVVESGDGGGLMTIQNAGVAVGARSILDVTTGGGVLFAASDTGSAITLQTSLDTAVVETRSSVQSGMRLKCSSEGGSGTEFLCSMSPLLTAYTPGMVLHWIPDVDGAGGPTTLDVDGLGAVTIKLADGITDPGPGELIGGRLYEIWHDGTVFRFVNLGMAGGTLAETEPVCIAALRGRVWFVAGGSGIKDSFSVCAKDAGDVYAWRSIY